MEEVGQDVELAFLYPDEENPTIGQHELKTSPLVTKDAVDISGGFAQRGSLGRVLSVHADGLPERTVDPRLYLNLDTPSSGLVCGVQGSGKSHTVSCILESSLMVDSRIGTLPAPLGTVVFHFDEENGQRPCEAAYLSALKGGAKKGVEEVVVLVSPSNLRTRCHVYAPLKFVQVHPLRIAEKDLNAARMLSMMGCDNLDALPLYLHSALSILRDMGSDGFSYQEFKEKLKKSKFNKGQGAMLKLRMALLDSFLQGTEPDVTSFFKAGRLVIVDISDPFVEASTAAMLFDICLGLFIEWESTTGKLIVLDEAHKYLTNVDANRFTRTICSIIRQQRHRAARVIVSTQEPTVVPPSVLDLLSWIVAHRFSSPSWVGHLKRHVCVREDGHDGGETSTAPDKTQEWGRKVMLLRTGEGVLFSPAALFVTKDGNQAPLATGYAIIKTRPRLTSDGGESLLATDARGDDAGPLSPKTEVLSSPTLSAVTTSYELPSVPPPLSPSIHPNTPPPDTVDISLKEEHANASAETPVQRTTSSKSVSQTRGTIPVNNYPSKYHTVLLALFNISANAQPGSRVAMATLMNGLRREYPGAREAYLASLVEDARVGQALSVESTGTATRWVILGDPKVALRSLRSTTTPVVQDQSTRPPPSTEQS